MSDAAPICIAVLAHNEAARIATCLNSLPLNNPEVAIHVVVNGSTDATASIAADIASTASNVRVHVFKEGGKARSWNRFLFDQLTAFHATHVFVDGDSEIVPGSIAALEATLKAQPGANAAAGLPMNGRKMAYYQQAMRAEHGMFGDLYALRGDFLSRMKAANIRLPDDVIGDDGLICAMAKTDLADESQWRDQRVAICEGAGFLCAPVRLLSPASWQMQYRRMINYSQRHYQNLLISSLLESGGATALPRELAPLYKAALGDWRPRLGVAGWFDRLALRRMAEVAK